MQAAYCTGVPGARLAENRLMLSHPRLLQVVVPVRICVPRIACVKPAAPQGPGCRLRFAVVLLHHVRSADYDLADVAGRQGVILFVEYPALLARKGKTQRSGFMDAGVRIGAGQTGAL